MIILRDDKRIARLRKISQYASFAGMALLIGGLVFAFTNIQNVFLFQLLALTGGWLLSQLGIFLAQRYLVDPRPDEVLDKELKKVARNGHLYHYLLPPPHVLLLPSGIIIFVPKYQSGKISVDGERWKQSGVGLRKFFGQEGLGNPTREATTMIKALASYIHKYAPSVEEVPIGVVIVFTKKGLNTLDLKNSSIPAMHYTKLKSFMRQQRAEAKPIPAEDYEAIKAAFDQKITHLVESE